MRTPKEIKEAIPASIVGRNTDALLRLVVELLLDIRGLLSKKGDK